MAEIAAVPGVIARPEVRVEGRAKVTGAARYSADVRREGTLWLAYARSPIPHGRILAVDVAAARASPGVHAVLTGDDVRPARMGRRLYDWPVLAWDRVRFIGDRVAAVAADTREGAREAADLVDVDYDELPAVLDLTRALDDDAPIVHEAPDDYRYEGGTRPPRSHPNVQGNTRIRRGAEDLEAVFAGAAHVFEHEFSAPRQYQGHIEPHACLVWIDGETVHVVSSNKTPFQLRAQLAETLDLPEDLIDVENRYIGGDFGGKGMSLDEYTCWYLARATGRPIRAVMDSAAEFQAANPRHGARLHLRTAVDADGRFLAHQSRVVFDGGAYAAAKPSATLTPAGGTLTLAPYAVPTVDLEVTTVYTNTVPAGHMRGPGETQALFASESHVDLIAAGLGIEPLELRLRNVVRAGDTGANGVRYEAPRAAEVLETLRRSTAGQRPLPAGHGRGMALAVRRPGGGKSSVVLSLRHDATIELLTGAADQGGGTHTALRRIAAATLSVAEERIEVAFRSTGDGPLDAGAGGSRLTFVTGKAAELAARELKPQLEALAAERLGVAPADVELRDDAFIQRASAMPATAFVLAVGGAELPPVTGTFDSRSGGGGEEAAPSFIAYSVDVHVDAETGQVSVEDVALVVDVGAIVNPVAHQGQLNGGFVFGLGGALMEEFVIEDGKVATVGLGEYKLPTTMDLPRFRTILLPAEAGSGAFGGKMVGELSNGAVAAAVANAVAAATGARLTTYPLTAERVLGAIRARSVGRSPLPGG